MNRLVLTAVVLMSNVTNAQGPKPTPEREYLFKQVGKWDAEVKITGAAEPMKGTLEVKKLGNFWITSTLKADFGQLKYEGRGTKGYDPHKKKFVGAWADTITDSLATPEGTLDESGKTLNESWSQTLPDGATAYFKLVTTHDGDDKMKAVYHTGKAADDLKEVMTIEYTRVKAAEKKKN